MSDHSNFEIPAFAENFVFCEGFLLRRACNLENEFQTFVRKLIHADDSDSLIELAKELIDCLTDRMSTKLPCMGAWLGLMQIPQEILLDDEVLGLIFEALVDEEQPFVHRGQWAGVIPYLVKGSEGEELASLRYELIPTLSEIMLSESFLSMPYTDWVHDHLVHACAVLKPASGNMDPRDIRRLRQALEAIPKCEAAIRSKTFSAHKPALRLAETLEVELEIVTDLRRAVA